MAENYALYFIFLSQFVSNSAYLCSNGINNRKLLSLYIISIIRLRPLGLFLPPLNLRQAALNHNLRFSAGTSLVGKDFSLVYGGGANSALRNMSGY